MKTRTQELTHPALDWAVAKCEAVDGLNVRIAHGQLYVVGDSEIGNHIDFDGDNWQPSGNWSQGGPIIEREWLEVKPWPNESDEDTRWRAKSYDTLMPTWATGPTPLIAAMRCYVASKMGDEIEIPEELL